MKEMLSKTFNINKLTKTFLVNNKIKKNNLTVFEPKHPYRVVKNQRDTTEPNGNL